MAGDRIGDQAALRELRDEMVQLGESEEQIDFGNLLRELLLVALDQTSDGHDGLDAPPLSFSFAAARMASMDSCLAASMKPHVFTRMTSASGSTGVTTAPWPTSSPTSRSESTVALSQPSEMTPSFIRDSSRI